MTTLSKRLKRFLRGKRRSKRPGPNDPCVQTGALVWRRDPELKVLLITSRENRRWVIPKGWPMHDLSDDRAAAQEALEEAGVVGEVAAQPVGAYGYAKRLKSGQTRLCTVRVYPLKLRQERARWREQDVRERRWFAPAEAAQLVQEPELKRLITAFAETAA